MRFTVRCDRPDCGDYVAHGDSLMDAQEIKKRHDAFRGHDADITPDYSNPLEGLL